MVTKIIMPQLGESVVEGTVNRWLKRVGERVEEYEPLVEISTDKVDTEIPAPASGVLLKIYVEEGQTVERGALLAVIGQPGETAPNTPGRRAREQTSAPTHETSNGQTDAATTSPRYSPVVMRMAAEHNLDLSQIQGSGLGGRVTKKDVEAYLATREASPAGKPEVAAWEQPVGGDLFKPTDEVFRKASGARAERAPAPQAAPPAPAPADLPGELVPLSAMRRLIAEHMVRSKLHTAPHVTTVFEIDMTKVMAHWRANEEPFRQQGVRLTLTVYFVAALVRAAQARPLLNSRWTEQGIFIHHVVNVGMAVALDDGLIVPVIRNAQDLSLTGIARQVSDLAVRARNRALKPDEITGGTITLTNHGVSGSLFATPIINQPQSAIVGVGAVQKRVVVLQDADGNDVIAIRPMLYATLTFDHRVADGAVGDAFMQTFKQTLERWS